MSFIVLRKGIFLKPSTGVILTSNCHCLLLAMSLAQQATQPGRPPTTDILSAAQRRELLAAFRQDRKSSIWPKVEDFCDPKYVAINKRGYDRIIILSDIPARGARRES
jgi:hypothetical protein